MVGRRWTVNDSMAEYFILITTVRVVFGSINSGLGGEGGKVTLLRAQLVYSTCHECSQAHKWVRGQGRCSKQGVA